MKIILFPCPFRNVFDSSMLHCMEKLITATALYILVCQNDVLKIPNTLSNRSANARIKSSYEIMPRTIIWTQRADCNQNSTEVHVKNVFKIFFMTKLNNLGKIIIMSFDVLKQTNSDAFDLQELLIFAYLTENYLPWS